MSQPFIGQIIQGGWNFAPRGYAMCNGQSMGIAQNTALFSLLGTTFGGNGQTTFNLPDLQGRSMAHWGNGAGLSPVVLGQNGGTQNVTLTSANLPSHTHTLNVSGAVKSTLQQAAANTVIARSVDLDTNVNGNPAIYAPAGTAVDTTLAPGSIGMAGNNVPFSNLSPYLAVTHVIALQGIFPSRN